MIYILSKLESGKAIDVLESLYADTRNRCLSKLDHKVAERLMLAMREENQQEVKDLLHYKPKSAGSLMISRIFALSESTTAAAAIQALHVSVSDGVVFYVYVVDDQKRLTGVSSLRQLLLADPDKPLKEFMNTRVIKVTADTPQEEAAKQVTRYHLLAMPVVDNQGILLGKITIDSLIQVIQEENINSMMKLAGSGSKKTDILAQSPFHIFKARVPWLISAFIGYLLISVILGGFEETLSTVVQLAFFFPIVIGMSGNTGTQTGTVVVRGLALGTITSNDFFKLLFKEVGANVLQGAVYGGSLGVAAYLIFQNPLLSMTVGPALMFNIIASAAIAMSLPFFFQKIGADPAVAAGPLALTFIDLVGSSNYLIIAYLMFKPGA